MVTTLLVHLFTCHLIWHMFFCSVSKSKQLNESRQVWSKPVYLTFICKMFLSILFYSRLCPSTARSIPPPESSIFLCPLLSLSIPVVFLSCPLVKKHADLSGSFLYSQSTMKNMYSKPTNRTKLSIPMKTKSIA